mgnify:CR=1 FL=1
MPLLRLQVVQAGYTMINPPRVNYTSSDVTDNVTLEYKYGVLENKYVKKETQYQIKLLSVKITNNTNKDLTFGQNLKLQYSNGANADIVDNSTAYELLRQSSGSHFLYLLLTPLNFHTTDAQGRQTSSTPIGLVLGPVLSLLNFGAGCLYMI